jgi:hypothetical protein
MVGGKKKMPATARASAVPEKKTAPNQRFVFLRQAKIAALPSLPANTYRLRRRCPA